MVTLVFFVRCATKLRSKALRSPSAQVPVVVVVSTPFHRIGGLAIDRVTITLRQASAGGYSERLTLTPAKSDLSSLVTVVKCYLGSLTA